MVKLDYTFFWTSIGLFLLGWGSAIVLIKTGSPWALGLTLYLFLFSMSLLWANDCWWHRTTVRHLKVTDFCDWPPGMPIRAVMEVFRSRAADGLPPPAFREDLVSYYAETVDDGYMSLVEGLKWCVFIDQVPKSNKYPNPNLIPLNLPIECTL